MRNLSTHVDNQRRSRDQRIAHLQHQKDDAERELARLRREAAQQSLPDHAGPAYVHGESRYGPRATGRGRDTAVMPVHYGEPEVASDDGRFAYDASADADADYADAAYGDAAYGDAAYGDAAYGERPFEDEPFEDEPLPDERVGADAFSEESYGNDASGGEAYSSEASGSEAFGSDASGSAAFREQAADPGYPEPASEDPALAGAPDGGEHSRDGRTERLVSRGRWSAQSPWLSRKRLIAVGAAAGVLLILILVLVLTGSGASWPASVATVQNEIAKACQNPDVASEPGQVNFACGKTTRQVLWVFALLTSNDNPHFNDLKTGRVGLEPITPAEGGEVAWSLNLHHPYYPADPIDSLEVAARAINNIVGGATLTGERRQLGGPAGPGEQLGQLPALHRIGRAARPHGLPQRVRPAGHHVRRGRPPWSPTSTRSGWSAPGRGRPRTPRCCSRTATTPATRRCRRCSGSLRTPPGDLTGHSGPGPAGNGGATQRLGGEVDP